MGKALVPKSRPMQKLETTELLINGSGLDRKKYPVVMVWERGYYRDDMGIPGKNDRGMYDDFCAIVSPTCYATFNANVDPSRYKKGKGYGRDKGMASLKPGLYLAHKIGLHKGQYTAAVQRLAKVTVIRDGVNGDYEETGMFGINCHRGGNNGTSSLGCLTIPKEQYAAWIALLQAELKRHKQTTIPLLLVQK